jgi:hypothetical protein
MSKNRLAYIFIILILSMYLYGCKNNEQSNIYDDITNKEEVNTIIVLSAPEELNSFLIGSQVYLLVQLVSDNTVLIRGDRTKIFEIEKDKQIPIENNPNYTPPMFQIQPTGPIAFRSAVISMTPELGTQQEPTTLRFIVSGNLYDNKKIGKQIFAYIDVNLHP